MADVYMKTLKVGTDGDTLHPLPIVTTEDDGKILMVTNGEWGAASLIDAENTEY